MNAQQRLARLARLVPAGNSTAARTPFVLLVVVLLGSGLLALLLLNASLNQGSFRLSELKKQTEQLTEQQQALQQEVDTYSAPGALEQRARELGLVPGGNPAFLLPDGTVRGVPEPATAEPARIRKPTPDPSPESARSPGPAPAPDPPTSPNPNPDPASSNPDEKPEPSGTDAAPSGHPAPGSSAPGSSASGPDPGVSPTGRGREAAAGQVGR